jgi:membrane protease YdiL (CAAX protease family)
MVGSRVGQTHARMLGMASVISRTSTRLLASAPNYIEASALVAIAVASRLLHHPIFWSFNACLCASIALIITVFLYACVGKGRIFVYLGWVKPRSSIYWLYALVGGLSGAAVVALLMRLTGGSLGTASANELFYGATIGPIIEEMIYRGAAFSVVYVTACSFNTLAHWQIALPVSLSSLFFAWSHTRIIGLPWLLVLMMGIGYALVRWRSNSTAASALMHASYNGFIALTMLRS